MKRNQQFPRKSWKTYERHAAILRFRKDALLTAKPLGKVGKSGQEPGKATKSGKIQEELAQVCKIWQRQAARLGKAATNCQKPRLVILSITRKRLLHRTHLINKKYCHTGTALFYRQILSRSTIHFARGWPIRVIRNYCKKKCCTG